MSLLRRPVNGLLIALAVAALSQPLAAWAAPDCETPVTARDWAGQDVFLLGDECWTGAHTNIGRLTIPPAFVLQALPGAELSIEAVEVSVLGHLSADLAGLPGGAGGGRGEGGQPGSGPGAGSPGDDVPDCSQNPDIVRRNAGAGGGGASSYHGAGGVGGHGSDAADAGCQGQPGGAGGTTHGSTSLASLTLGSGAGGGGGAGGTHFQAGESGDRGGGLIKLFARTVSIADDGRVSADGGEGGRGGTSSDIFHGGGGGGGASGGAIYIRTTYLVGDGIVSALGGPGGIGGDGDIRNDNQFSGSGGDGGGGGRVLVERSVATAWTGTCDSRGGDGGAGVNTNDPEGSADGADGECIVRHANGAPEADAGGPYAGAEGTDITLDASDSTDPDGDTLTYSWDLGCDDSVDLTGQTVTTFYADQQDDLYVVCLTVADSEFEHSATSFVTVFDAVPVASLVLPEEPPNEGSEFTADASGSSASGGGRITDTITEISWDFDYDIATGFVDRGVTGLTQNHTFTDNGRFFIAVRVTDDDGSQAVQVGAIDVLNVPPTITTTAVSEAEEAIEWTYTMGIEDPGSEDTHVFEVLSGPLGLAVNEDTGVFTWTPLYQHAVVGDLVARLSVTDNDFGRDIEEVVFSVTPADSDGDGMPDGWELDQVPPLDPNVDDSLEDGDQDGISNLDEFDRGTDPWAFDGPGAPRLAFPPLGFEVAYPVDSELTVFEATDADDSPLTYRIAVYDTDPESELSPETVLQGDDIQPDGITASFFLTPDDELADNTRYWWRAWATDGLVFGPPSEVGNFFVNGQQDCPTVPVLLTPADEGRVTSRQPVFVVGNSVDEDQDPVFYVFLIYEDEALQRAIVNSGLVGEGAGTTTTWQPDIELLDHQEYYWRVKAIDGEGCESGFTGVRSFLTTIGNLTPSAPVIVSPEDGSSTGDGRPSIVVENATDPDRDFLTYFFEIDTESTFDTVNHQESGSISEGLPSEGTSWQVPDTLADNAVYLVRVQAHDGVAAGPFAESTFRVNYINDSPTAPIPINPPNGSTIENQRPRLSVENATDPDGETLLYHFQVFADEDMEDLALERDDIPESVEITFWRVNQPLISGPYWWRARAIDHAGGGPWSDLHRFTISLSRRNDFDGGVVLEDAGSGQSTSTAVDDCNCSASNGNPSAAFWILLALGHLVVNTRRRRSRRS